jgi:hypothetical protein
LGPLRMRIRQEVRNLCGLVELFSGFRTAQDEEEGRLSELFSRLCWDP